MERIGGVLADHTHLPISREPTNKVLKVPLPNLSEYERRIIYNQCWELPIFLEMAFKRMQIFGLGAFGCCFWLIRSENVVAVKD